MLRYWEKKKPPAVLKHSVLWRYLRVFVPKTASRARDRRVVYVDAFAGAGRYEDGDPASPMLAMMRAAEFARYARPIHLDCLFVEKRQDACETLKHVVPPERVRCGTIEACLPGVLQRARGQPLFMFVDPFGQPIAFQDLTERILARPRGQGLATEVLLNFSVTALQRNAGRLVQSKQRAHAAAVLRRFDAAMNGGWWHERGRILVADSGASDVERERAEKSIVEEYAEGVRNATGYVPVASPIWRHRWKEGRPFFYLLLFTAHKQGVWFYADGLADAMDDYYEATHRDGDDLFDRPEERRSRATATIVTNVRRLVSDHGRFTLLDRTLEVLHGVLGDGGRNEVAAALRVLAKNDEVIIEGPTTASEIYKAKVLRGSAQSLFS